MKMEAFMMKPRNLDAGGPSFITTNKDLAFLWAKIHKLDCEGYELQKLEIYDKPDFGDTSFLYIRARSFREKEEGKPSQVLFEYKGTFTVEDLRNEYGEDADLILKGEQCFTDDTISIFRLNKNDPDDLMFFEKISFEDFENFDAIFSNDLDLLEEKMKKSLFKLENTGTLKTLKILKEKE